MEEQRMRSTIRLVLWGVFILILVLSASCSPSPAGSATGAEQESPAVEVEDTAESEEEVVDPVAEEEPEVPAEDTGTGGEPVSETGIAADIPVPEEAYQVQVARKGTTISFQIDATVDEVVGFLQENLEAMGWEMAGPPDTSVGSIATLFRKNEAGDQLSINMQGNELGGFVRVTMVVQRAN
jgi:hypothetical protein